MDGTYVPTIDEEIATVEEWRTTPGSGVPIRVLYVLQEIRKRSDQDERLRVKCRSKGIIRSAALKTYGHPATWQ